MKGLSLHVYRNALGDATNGGISADNDVLMLVGYQMGQGTISPLPKSSRVFEPEDLDNAVILRIGPFGPSLVPLKIAQEGHAPGFVGPMMGGNYATSSDSRLSDLLRTLDQPPYAPIPVHDRMESAALYAALSSD